MELYPENKVSHFTVQLPKTVELDGSYEVAISEIFYPYSWFNFEADDDIWLYYGIGNLNVFATLHEGSYPSATHLIESLMKILSSKFRDVKEKHFERIQRIAHGVGTEEDKEIVNEGETAESVFRLNIEFNLLFNVHTQLTKLKISSDEAAVSFSPRLAQILRFDKDRFVGKGSFGKRLFDMTRINVIYTYCDLVEPHVVGDTLASLLGVVAAESDKSDKNVWIRYTKLQYQPVVKRFISDITI